MKQKYFRLLFLCFLINGILGAFALSCSDDTPQTEHNPQEIVATVSARATLHGTQYTGSGQRNGAFLQNSYALNSSWRENLLSDMLYRMRNYEVKTLILSGPKLLVNGTISEPSLDAATGYQDFLKRVKEFENTTGWNFEVFVMFNGSINPNDTESNMYVDYWGSGTGSPTFGATENATTSPQYKTAESALRFVTQSGDFTSKASVNGTTLAREFNGFLLDVEPTQYEVTGSSPRVVYNSYWGTTTGCAINSTSLAIDGGTQTNHTLNFDCIKNVGKVAREVFATNFTNASTRPKVGIATPFFGSSTGSIKHWTNNLYYYAARNYDLIVPMLYDTGMTDSSTYVTWYKNNVRNITMSMTGDIFNNPNGFPAPTHNPRVLFGAGAYLIPENTSHQTDVENVYNAASGIDLGTNEVVSAGKNASIVAGLAVFSQGSGCTNNEALCPTTANNPTTGTAPAKVFSLTEPNSRGRTYARFALFPANTAYNSSLFNGRDWDQWCVGYETCAGISGTGTRHVYLGTPSAYHANISGTNPVAWYRFDESSGTALYDWSGKNNHGTYLGANTDGVSMLNQSSAVDGGGASAHFGTANRDSAGNSANNGIYYGPYAEVADNDEVSITKGFDQMNRTVANGANWGTPTKPNGTGNWTSTNSAQVFSVVSNDGAKIRTTSNGTYGQIFPMNNRVQMNVQTKVRWTAFNVVNGVDTATTCPTTTSGSFQPVILAGRFIDASNFYAARLVESNGALNLQVVKRTPSGMSVLGTKALTTIPTYNCSSFSAPLLNVRLRITGTEASPLLVANAWLDGTQEQTSDNTASAFDSSGSAHGPGKAAILFSSSSPAHPRYIATYKDFFVQSDGMTISVWVRPAPPLSSTVDFLGSPSNLCGDGGTIPQNYVNYLSKSNPGGPNEVALPGGAEWQLRYYSSFSRDLACNNDRRNAYSVYGFPIYPVVSNGVVSSLGSGNRMPYPATGVPQAGTWHHVVGIYDSGDFTDPFAGITEFLDGVKRSKISGSNMVTGVAYNDYSVNMWNGPAPLRIGASYRTTAIGITRAWLQYQGDIDELVIWDKKMNDAEILSIYGFKQ